MNWKARVFVVAGVLLGVFAAGLALWYVRMRPAWDAFGTAWSDAQQVHSGMPLADAVALMRRHASRHHTCDISHPRGVRHVFIYGPSDEPDLATEVSLVGAGEPGQEIVLGVYFKDTSQRGMPHSCS